MSLLNLAICSSCRKRRFFTIRRTVNMPKLGQITSATPLCPQCYGKLKKLTGIMK